jgi:peroxiredoxin family protein
MSTRQMALFLESDSPTRLSHAATLVTSAVLLGRPVVVVWMGAALRKLVEGRLDEGLDGDGRPSALLAEARLLGPVTYYACSADSRGLGRSREELLAHVDDIHAMTTLLRRLDGAAPLLYL